jgi:hypothetical protein
VVLDLLLLSVGNAMLDFNNILSTPGYDIQYFQGSATASLTQWQTWRKPRGVNWVYMIGVGGGGGGGASRNNSTTSAGSGGGGSGAQTTVMIPAMFLPDLLYIQAGVGGAGGVYTGVSAGANGSAGLPTYVMLRPIEFVTGRAGVGLLLAGAGGGGTLGSATSGAGGGAGTAGVIADGPLAGLGFFNFIGGQAGGAGGAPAATGVSVTPPTTGLMVTGGAGGGGQSTTTPQVGGAIAAMTALPGQEFFPLPLNPGLVAITTSPAVASSSGFISRNYLFNFGGAGGSGSTNSSGGTSGQAGNGAPGCGGGGGGGENSSTGGVSKSGNGGPGFVYIISW